MLKIYNSLSRKIEAFQPLHPPEVKMYTCGPTVYDFAHIGNFRTYITADFLLRTLDYFGYKPKYIMNITDVGHLTGDNLGDADTGVDRMEKSAQKQGKSAWDIAKFYTEKFLEDFEKLNLIKPDQFTKATDHIKEQIELIKKLIDKGFTYKTSDGIYFDTSKFPDYGKLSTLDKKGLKAGIRIDLREKKHPTDFALWKFSNPRDKRQMEWLSPWGTGFPGWHIECSAMSMKYLGEQLDIHVGGEDLRSTHHPNEIAQSEAATGKQFVKYWVHGTFMNIDGKRMSKSLKNNYTLTDILNKGYKASAIRYLFLTTHYQQTLNFTFEALSGAQTAFQNLNDNVQIFKKSRRLELTPGKLQKIDLLREKFDSALKDDLNLPKALTVVWETVKSSIPSPDKYDLIKSFNEVLGLLFTEETAQIPSEISLLAKKRWELKNQGKFLEADQIRKEVESKGFIINDNPEGYKIKQGR